MNNKDNKLIYEAYIAEKVNDETELSSDQLDHIRSKFFPKEDIMFWTHVVVPNIEDFMKTGHLHSDVWAHSEFDVDKSGLINHLRELKAQLKPQVSEPGNQQNRSSSPFESPKQMRKSLIDVAYPGEKQIKI